MNNNSIQLRTKFDFCVLKFDLSLAQTLVPSFWKKISKIFSSSNLDLSSLGNRKNSGSRNQIALAGYAKIISHVLGFLHSSFAWLHRHKKSILMESPLLFKHRHKKRLCLNQYSLIPRSCLGIMNLSKIVTFSNFFIDWGIPVLK